LCNVCIILVRLLCTYLQVLSWPISQWGVVVAHHCCSMKVMVWHFVSGTHKAMTALLFYLQSVVVELFLQSHRFVWDLLAVLCSYALMSLCNCFEAYPHNLVVAWMRILLIFISYTSWVPAGIMTGSSLWSLNVTESKDAYFCFSSVLSLEQIFI